METLSIIIPCYNEEATIKRCLERVVMVDLPFGASKQVLVIDDGSRDNSRQIVQDFANSHLEVKLLAQPKNMGKGAAIRRGLKEAKGSLIVIQDADLEYDPEDFKQMMQLFRLKEVDVVFGSRRLLKSNAVSGLVQYWGAEIINFFTNIFYGARITDQFTCYKMFRSELLQKIPLKTSRFEIDAELTAKLLRMGQFVQEVPITYHPRTIAEGKKIRVKDGFLWLWQIVKHRFTSRSSW